MNEKAKILLKNLNYTISANFFVLGTSLFLNLVVPKFIGVKEYSFWQLYVFYSSYVGFFHFGWLDGIYLKIGGAKYEDLDKRNLGSQFWYLSLSQLFIGLIIVLYSVIGLTENDKKIIFICTALNLITTNCRLFVLYIMQSTNRIKEYAQISRSDRYIYIVGVAIYLIFQGKSFVPLIIMDAASKIVMMVWGFYKIRDMLLIKVMPIRNLYSEIWNNIKIGSNLMISSIASMLILGISRLMIERQWSIETFGKLSFTLSISNMFMMFINSVSVVMYPVLRRSKEEGLPKLYTNLRSLFVPITFSILLLYNPIKFILSAWLPEYSQSLVLMGILFPMVIYEGRMALLVSTYLKTIRKERIILVSNVATLLLSVSISFIAIFILKQLYLSVIAIIVALAFRCILAEKMLLSVMKMNLDAILLIEIGLTIVFIISNTLFSSGIGFVLYLSCFLIYMFINSKEIKNSYRTINKLMKE